MKNGITLGYWMELHKEIEEVYPSLEATQDQYLAAAENLRSAKYSLDRIIDNAYEQGMVVGKNERERDAHLRHQYPKWYEEIEELTRVLNACERAFRRDLIRYGKLEAIVKLLCLDVSVGSLDSLLESTPPILRTSES